MQQRELSLLADISRPLTTVEPSIIAKLPTLGAAMEFAAARAGYTHETIGGLIGYTRSAVSKILSGTRDITVGRMVTLMSRTGSYAPLQKLCEQCGGKFVQDAETLREQQRAIARQQIAAAERVLESLDYAA